MANEPRGQRIERLVQGAPDMPPEASRSRYACPVRDLWRESNRYLGIRLEVDDDLRAEQPQPGQYVTLSPSGVDPRFVVIANAPPSSSQEGWEFLIDRQTELGAAFDAVEVGTSLEVSAAEGPGYPVDEVHRRHVLCFATGSGIASIRPAIQYWHRHPELAPEQVAVYYGESHPGDFAYRDEARDWSRAGIRIYETCEADPESTEGGFRYVQHAFEYDDPALEKTTVLLSGAPPMKRAVVEKLLDRGLSLEAIATNI